jgi:hypothetical protein
VKEDWMRFLGPLQALDLDEWTSLALERLDLWMMDWTGWTELLMDNYSLDGTLYRIRALIKTTLMSRLSMSSSPSPFIQILSTNNKEETSVSKVADSNTILHRNAKDPPPTDKNANNKPSADQKSSTQHPQPV